MPDQMGLGTIGSFAKPAKKEKVLSDAAYHYRYIDRRPGGVCVVRPARAAARPGPRRRPRLVRARLAGCAACCLLAA